MIFKAQNLLRCSISFDYCCFFIFKW